VPVCSSFEEGPLVFIVSGETRKFRQPLGNGVLFEEHNGSVVPDSFRHEIIFAIRDTDGLYVFSGCSHQGIENVMDSVMERFPGVPVRAVFGGFHMTSPAAGKLLERESAVRETSEMLLQYSGCRYYTGHCTGVGAYNLMKDVMAEKIKLLASGDVIDFTPIHY
jgi:7,8-dihydropterin-6-yl-methyl-4-(beta-D-ribofuranosyl)aminobenzene 5'-phosphate synthase